jgi:hypothetical protein
MCGNSAVDLHAQCGMGGSFHWDALCWQSGSHVNSGGRCNVIATSWKQPPEGVPSGGCCLRCGSIFNGRPCITGTPAVCWLLVNVSASIADVPGCISCCAWIAGLLVLGCTSLHHLQLL